MEILTSPRLTDRVVDWMQEDGGLEAVGMVQPVSQCAASLLAVEAAVKVATKAENLVLIEGFKALVQNDSETWRDVSERGGVVTFMRR